MINLSDCIELGKITKCHGINGQVILKLSNPDIEEINEMELVFIKVDGLPVPFFISEHTERSGNSLVLTIDDIRNETDAREIIDCAVYIQNSQVELSDVPLLQSNDLVGFIVVDEKLGEIGKIERILDYDNNPLLQIIHKNRELLIPLHEDLIIELDSNKSILYIRAPEGILDI